MKNLLIIIAASLPLTGCMAMKGQAVFDMKPGPALTRAKGTCAMRARDVWTAEGSGEKFGGPIEAMAVVQDAYACFASQGVKLKGFRQPDGTLTKYPATWMRD